MTVYYVALYGQNQNHNSNHGGIYMYDNMENPSGSNAMKMLFGVIALNALAFIVFIYKKALNTQAKNLLCNPNVTTLKEADELVELTAKSEVSLGKENYTADGTIRLIMKLFLTLE